jgi:hypothetical protein
MVFYTRVCTKMAFYIIVISFSGSCERILPYGKQLGNKTKRFSKEGTQTGRK